MFALLLCIADEPCIALRGGWFAPVVASVVVIDSANRLQRWPAPAQYRRIVGTGVESGRFEIQLAPLMKGGFED
jgi:hypothetical protein